MNNIEFREKSKKNRRNIDIITNNLYDFIIKNKEYLRIAISIIGMKKHSLEKSLLVEYIEKNPNYDDIENDNEIETFKELMMEFYKEKIFYRRGDLLELLVYKISPLKENDYLGVEKIQEAKVYLNKKKLDEKDIDLVCIKELKDNKEIECIECKVSLNNFLREPLNEYNIKKIEFMIKVKELIELSQDYGSLYFATIDNGAKYLNEVLNNNGYSEFLIFDSKKIINRLLN